MSNVTITNIRATPWSLLHGLHFVHPSAGCQFRYAPVPLLRDSETWLGPPWKQTSWRHVNFSGKINTLLRAPRSASRSFVNHVFLIRSQIPADDGTLVGCAATVQDDEFRDARRRRERRARGESFASAIMTWRQKKKGKYANQGAIARHSISRLFRTSGRPFRTREMLVDTRVTMVTFVYSTGAVEVSKYSLHKYIHISLFSIRNRINSYISVFSTILILYNLLMSWTHINMNLICLPNFYNLRSSLTAIYTACLHTFTINSSPNNFFMWTSWSHPPR